MIFAYIYTSFFKNQMYTVIRMTRIITKQYITNFATYIGLRNHDFVDMHT